MLVAPFKAVLDANVLFPFTLRDTLLRAAAADLYQLCWSGEILDETQRNLVGKRITTPEQAARLRAAMTAAFPEALVTDYQHLTEKMPNDPKDRHVVAVAVRAGAQLIVTSNLRDFARLPAGIEAQSPDAFLCSLFELAPEVMVDLVRSQAAALRRPPRSFADVLRGLERLVPEFAQSVATASAST